MAAAAITEARGCQVLSHAACHSPGDRTVPAAYASVGTVRRAAPFIIGIAGTALLVAFYLVVVTWAQGWTHAVELLSQDRLFVAAIAVGFGIQIGLYAYLRLVVHYCVRLAVPTAAAGASTGTSSLAMVACCIHHVTDVLPVLGLSGAAIFLNQYRVPLMLAGLGVNVVGVIIMLRVVLQSRVHLKSAVAVAGGMQCND